MKKKRSKMRSVKHSDAAEAILLQPNMSFVELVTANQKIHLTPLRSAGDLGVGRFYI